MTVPTRLSATFADVSSGWRSLGWWTGKIVTVVVTLLVERLVDFTNGKIDESAGLAKSAIAALASAAWWQWLLVGFALYLVGIVTHAYLEAGQVEKKRAKARPNRNVRIPILGTIGEAAIDPEQKKGPSPAIQFGEGSSGNIIRGNQSFGRPLLGGELRDSVIENNVTVTTEALRAAAGQVPARAALLQRKLGCTDDSPTTRRGPAASARDCP